MEEILCRTTTVHTAAEEGAGPGKEETGTRA